MVKKLILLLILLLALSCSKTNKRFFPYKYTKLKLDNGLTAYLIPMEGTEQVAYYSVVRTGSRDEWEPGHSGFAHFFEHMMFRGTKRFPGNVYDQLVTKMGANSNAYTTDDYTCYYLIFPSEYLEKVIDIESDRFQNLSYAEPEFKTEAGAVYGEYRKGRTNPFWLLEEAMYDLAFTRHTYKHTTIGFEKDIKAMPTMYQYSLRFFKRYYRPENVVLLIVGNIDTEKTKQLIRQYYGSWKSGYEPPKIEPEPPQKEERYKEITYPGKTKPILAIGYKSDRFKPDDRLYAAAMLFGDLAFGQTSALYKKLVLDEQKVEFIFPSFGMNRDPNLFTIATRLHSMEDVEYVKKAIDQTIRTFQKTPVNKKDLEMIKKHNRYQFLMNLDTPGRVAGNLARLVAITGGIEVIDTWYATLDEVTPEDVLQAAKTYFQPEKRTIILIKGGK